MRLLSLLLLLGCRSAPPPQDLPQPERIPDAADPLLSIVVEAGDAPTCVGLQCRQQDCGHLPDTTVSGIVRDPSGKGGVAGAVVYVPNSGVSGFPTTPRICAALLDPLTTTTTDVDGRFTLHHVPVGYGMPILIQAGRFRRSLSVNVEPCVDTPLDPEKTRLPRKTLEGTLPRIALATGCDQVECVLRDRIGIDDSEFGAPGSTAHVHLYRGIDKGQGLPVQNPGDAYGLYGSSSIKQYDLVIAASECGTYARDTKGTAYKNMDSYLASSGRLFAGRDQYNWFASATQCPTGYGPCGGSNFSLSAAWFQASGQTPPFMIDTSFPRGMFLKDWLTHRTKDASGTVLLNGTMSNVGKTVKGDRFVYAGSPTNGDAYAFRMGNGGVATYLDFEIAGMRPNATSSWPTSCSGQASPSHEVSELLFEFMLFDWPSCVESNKGFPPGVMD